MSQTQVQLVGNVVTGAVFTGIVTASTALNVSNNVGLNSSGINVTGVITATTFSGDGSGLTGVGVGTEDNINTSGIITASTISANEFIGTGDKLIFSPSATSFSPTSGATDVSLTPSISITFNQPIYAGVGSIFLRNSSGIGTEIEAIGIGSTTQVSISSQTLTITPSSPLPTNTVIYTVLPQGVITNSVAGNNALLDTYSFTTVDFQFSSISPTNGATDVGIGTTISITFTAAPTRGTGTVELKSGNALTGTLIESFDAASSDRISIVGNEWRLDPTSDLGFTTSIHPIIPNGAITSYTGINTVGAALTYSFTTRGPLLGEAYEGGFLICQAGGTRWVVSPLSAEVSRSWHSRGDSNTRAQQVSGCTGWFVPTCNQIQNPGYVCRTNWDGYASNYPTPPAGASGSWYWSDSQLDIRPDNPSWAWLINMSNGTMNFDVGGTNNKNLTLCVRSFRCVSY
jgi:hypothetical protein